MAEVLVLANETIGGASLLQAVSDRHAEGDARFHVVVPQTRPRYGNVIYDEAVRDSAQVRVDLALAFMRERRALPLAPCSAYHLGGEARHGWEHSIAPIEATRWSITFRSLSVKGRIASDRAAR